MWKFKQTVFSILLCAIVLMVYYANRTFSNFGGFQYHTYLGTRFYGVSKDGPPKHYFCQSKTETYTQDEYVDMNNTAWPWNISATWDCPEYYFNQPSNFRWKAQLDCSSGSARIVYTETNSPLDIQVVKPDDKCLLSYIENCCLDKDKPVPNVMNYIWYSDVEVGFFTMVSFVSVVRFMRPCLILFHGPYIPRGKYWNFLISIYPNIILVNETLINDIFGHKLRFKEHGSDVMRIRALKRYGGLYLDWDQILVKSVDSLRQHNFTMSLETPGGLGNQFIMAKQNATFLEHWYNGYKNYTGAWAFNSIQYPMILSKQYPHLINKLHFIGLKPKQRGGELWHINTDWSQNYALHLYLRGFKRRASVNIVTIRHENTTIGAVCRLVLFGRKEMCKR